jgi:hypothetical protein
MLEASKVETDPNAEPTPADPTNSLELLWDRVNEKLALGLPEAISDKDIDALVARYQRQRLRWESEEAAKADRPRAKRGTKTAQTAAEAIEW